MLLRRNSCLVKLELVVSWYLPRGVVRRLQVISEDFLKLALSCDRFVGCAGSAAVTDWIPRRLLRLVVRMQTPCSSQLVAGRRTDPTSPPGLSPTACSVFVFFGGFFVCFFFVLCLYCQPLPW